MARPIQFNIEVAVEAAMEQFWQIGYEANTVSTLSQHLGILDPAFTILSHHVKNCFVC